MKTKHKAPVPPFWCGTTEAVQRQLDAVETGRLQEAGRSAGGRPLYLLEYGQREPFTTEANYGSAVAAKRPAAHLDRRTRIRPVVFLIGPVHGSETEGLTGLMNLTALLETGWDLRDTPHGELKELAEACHLLILPAGNPDGLSRFTPGCAAGMEQEDYNRWTLGSISGRALVWPDNKARHPMRGEDVDFPGCYYNDDGINMMHDDFFRPMSAEVSIVLDIARTHAPDLIISLHSANAMYFIQPAFVPMFIKRQGAALALRLRDGLRAAGFPAAEPFEPAPCGTEGPPGPSFNLISALHHVSGALALTLEAPTARLTGDGPDALSLEDILDMHLVMFRELFRYSLEINDEHVNCNCEGGKNS